MHRRSALKYEFYDDGFVICGNDESVYGFMVEIMYCKQNVFNFKYCRFVAFLHGL